MADRIFRYWLYALTVIFFILTAVLLAGCGDSSNEDVNDCNDSFEFTTWDSI